MTWWLHRHYWWRMAQLLLLLLLPVILTMHSTWYVVMITTHWRVIVQETCTRPLCQTPDTQAWIFRCCLGVNPECFQHTVQVYFIILVTHMKLVQKLLTVRIAVDLVGNAYDTKKHETKFLYSIFDWNLIQFLFATVHSDLQTFVMWHQVISFSFSLGFLCF